MEITWELVKVQIPGHFTELLNQDLPLGVEKALFKTNTQRDCAVRLLLALAPVKGEVGVTILGVRIMV